MSRSPSIDDPHAILGISPGATTEEVRAAFRAKARACHPDVNPGAGAAAAFETLRRAYEAILAEPPRDLTPPDDPCGDARGGHVNWANIGSRGPGAGPVDDDELGSAFDAVFGGG